MIDYSSSRSVGESKLILSTIIDFILIPVDANGLIPLTHNK